MRGPVRLILGSLATTTALACSVGGPSPDPEHDPSVRIPAIKRAVRAGDLSSARQMVRDLRSDDPAIRLYAIEGLERLTGETLGYRYYDDEAKRAGSIKNWDAWLDEQEKTAKAP